MTYAQYDPNEQKHMAFVEDVSEGMDRMMDEGGGVVDEVIAYRTPTMRNDLVEKNAVDYQQTE
ncbi:hypothetical protein DFP93_11862 [Aneurinibacillus soli]|uniref:Uncharacterized protein n=1 Tax=Aneurinibacillus soli TaxID=1500254 RepID=A0A0U5AS94_9BACL|nr:hypothetical protein [Aneurinibacillus soli]PYE59312.1 hypothetical protein DFP93_11862 [Aneurinibacillus soli]BAU26698.1 hypothetical protein CB4_00841 [Aneurinibacillus soli]